MSMKYAYQRAGGPILNWSSGPPLQSRAADAASLGSLGGSLGGGSTLDHPTLVLPAPGAPEPIGVTRSGMSGCSCHGSCGCGSGMSGLVDSVPGGYLTLVAAAFVAWRMLRKRGR